MTTVAAGGAYRSSLWAYRCSFVSVINSVWLVCVVFFFSRYLDAMLKIWPIQTSLSKCRYAFIYSLYWSHLLSWLWQLQSIRRNIHWDTSAHISSVLFPLNNLPWAHRPCTQHIELASLIIQMVTDFTISVHLCYVLWKNRGQMRQ